jgi:hypothetical protein
MTKLCDYGCGHSGQHQLKNKNWCCESNTSKCPAVKLKLGSGGYDYDLLSDEVKLKMSHKGQVFSSAEDVFVDGKEWSSEFLRKYLHHYKILEYKCAGEGCGLTDWYGQHLVLELDHINGKRADNRKENLRWLCPNCHSQTDTFRGRNKNPGKQKVTDAILLTALKEHSNIRQALQSVGLAAKGGNYERATKLSKQLPG